jgi:hypothetical protein
MLIFNQTRKAHHFNQMLCTRRWQQQRAMQ